MKIVKYVNYKKTYVSKKTGKELPSVNYYLKLDNGKSIMIRPVFSPIGYTELDTIAELVINKD